MKIRDNWPKWALNTLREISSRELVWLSKSCASACKFQIQVVVFGPLANVREKCPGCAHFSNDVATGFLSTMTLTLLASSSLELIFFYSPFLRHINRKPANLY
jgi:hypothetical protein